MKFTHAIHQFNECFHFFSTLLSTWIISYLVFVYQQLPISLCKVISTLPSYTNARWCRSKINGLLSHIQKQINSNTTKKYFCIFQLFLMSGLPMKNVHKFVKWIHRYTYGHTDIQKAYTPYAQYLDTNSSRITEAPKVDDERIATVYLVTPFITI